ncbi:uncharacterized protein LOC113468587 [Diaphorina citri]|uniref:Uncharacterized protein LOC113468587 n=1 Tax=Diaphorina citri TaxID=121845 RepID=A0A3Q0IYU4_DIACI|nr:uncharacterized protein LOC113468587 [Diaphorina citri]
MKTKVNKGKEEARTKDTEEKENPVWRPWRRQFATGRMLWMCTGVAVIKEPSLMKRRVSSAINSWTCMMRRLNCKRNVNSFSWMRYVRHKLNAIEIAANKVRIAMMIR